MFWTTKKENPMSDPYIETLAEIEVSQILGTLNRYGEWVCAPFKKGLDLFWSDILNQKPLENIDDYTPKWLLKHTAQGECVGTYILALDEAANHIIVVFQDSTLPLTEEGLDKPAGLLFLENAENVDDGIIMLAYFLQDVFKNSLKNFEPVHTEFTGNNTIH
jgi:hypothetical protein